MLVFGSEAVEPTCVTFEHNASPSEYEFEADAKPESERRYRVARAESDRGGLPQGVALVATDESALNALAVGQRAFERSLQRRPRHGDRVEWGGESAVHAEPECLHAASTEPRERRHFADGVHAIGQLLQFLVQLARSSCSAPNASAGHHVSVQHARELHFGHLVAEFEFGCFERGSRCGRTRIHEVLRQRTAPVFDWRRRGSAAAAAESHEQYSGNSSGAHERCAHGECVKSRHCALPDVALRGALHSEGSLPRRPSRFLIIARAHLFDHRTLPILLLLITVVVGVS